METAFCMKLRNVMQHVGIRQRVLKILASPPAVHRWDIGRSVFFLRAPFLRIEQIQLSRVLRNSVSFPAMSKPWTSTSCGGGPMCIMSS